MMYAQSYDQLRHAFSQVQEETCFDVSKLLIKEEYIEMIFGQQRVRLYIVAGVKNDTSFAPLTMKEISEIAWQRIDELQPANDGVISHGVTGLKLYMVAPFLGSRKSKTESVWRTKKLSLHSKSKC